MSAVMIASPVWSQAPFLAEANSSPSYYMKLFLGPLSMTCSWEDLKSK